MRNKNLKIFSGIISFSLLSSIASAESFDWDEGYFELKGAVGPTWLQAHATDVQLSPYEILHTNFDNLSAFNATLGVAYALPLLEENDDFSWLPFVKASIDVAHQFEQTFSGDITQVGWTSEWDNQTKIENTNLMFNLSLGLLQYDDLSVFILGGVGAAWTQVTYNAENGSVDTKDVHLGEQNTTTFASQGGAGLGYLIAPDLNLTGTWLYTHIGDIKVS
ncbi:MAG: outer membrane beta-barrel protein, partial [Gammaproteobacteria bacterium]